MPINSEVKPLMVEPVSNNKTFKNQLAIDLNSLKASPNFIDDVSASKRRLLTRQHRDAKPIGFYENRLNYIQKRRNEVKDATRKMEDAIAEGLSVHEKVLKGELSVEAVFEPYRKALQFFKKTQVEIRRALLIERKTAAEVWGDNEVAVFQDGVYTVDKGAIETCLTPSLKNLSIAKTRSTSERVSKPVSRLIENVELSSSTKMVKKKPHKVKTIAKPKNHLKVITPPVKVSPQQPVCKLRFKKEFIADPSGFSSPSASDFSILQSDKRAKSASPDVAPKRKRVSEDVVPK